MTATSAQTGQPVHPIAKELVASSGFLLARLGLDFKSTATSQIKHEGFEAHDYSVLAVLGEGVRETQATIADALDLDPSRLVSILDSLEERGLVTRRRDPHDRRRHVVRITPTGEQQLLKLRSAVRALEDDFFAPLNAQDRAHFRRQLLQLASHHDPRWGFAPATSSSTW